MLPIPTLPNPHLVVDKFSMKVASWAAFASQLRQYGILAPIAGPTCTPITSQVPIFPWDRTRFVLSGLRTHHPHHHNRIPTSGWRTTVSFSRMITFFLDMFFPHHRLVGANLCAIGKFTLHRPQKKKRNNNQTKEKQKQTMTPTTTKT